MCGFIGVYGPEGVDVAPEIYEGLLSIQHRGQDAAGITTFTDIFHLKKGKGLVRDIFERQRLARKEKKGPSGGGEWDGRVIVRIPKVSADGDIDELDDEAVGTDDSDFVAVDSSDDGDEEIVEAEDEESPETEITKAASFDEKSPAEASVPSSGKSKATLSKVAERKLTELQKFKDEHGHLNVSQMGATKNLYQWLHRRKVQRDDFLAGKKVALTQEEFDRLNELGVDWSIGKQTKNPTP